MCEGRSALKKTSVLAVLVLIALGSANQAATAGGLEDARQRGKLLVGVKSDFPPFGYVDESGALRGFDVEVARYLARALFNDTGERLELVPVTSGSRIPYLYNGWVDVIVASMTFTEERNRVLEFSDPYFLSGSLILVQQGSTIEGIKDLARKRVAVLEASVQSEDLEQIAPLAIRIRFATLGEAVEALKDKRVEAVCTDDAASLYLAQENKDLKIVGTSFNPHPYAIAVRKGDLELVKWINTKLKKMREDETYEEFWRKYLKEGHYEKLWQKNPGETGSLSLKP